MSRSSTFDPVLVEGVRRRARRVEPHGLAALALAELRARTATAAACTRSRAPGSPRPAAGRAPDQLEARGDVAPLVGAAHLHLDAVLPVQGREVERLERHVAELGEREPALEPRLDGVLGQHVRHREVLADVAQVVDQRDRARASRSCWPSRPGRGPGEKSRNRSSCAWIAATLCSRVGTSSRFALGGAPRRVADHPRAAADQRDRPAAVLLEPEQAEDRDQVADVERVRGGVEPDVGGDRAGRSRGARRGRASWRGGSRATRARRAGRARPGRRCRGVSASSVRHTCGERKRHGSGPERGIGSSIPCMVSFRPACKPASPGGSAIAVRPQRAARVAAAPSKSSLVALPLLLFAPCLLLGAAGAAVAVVGAYSYLAKDLPGPQAALEAIDVHPADRRLRPHRQGPAGEARLGPPRARHLRRHPAGAGRRDDRRSRTRPSGRTPASTRRLRLGHASTRSRATTAAAPRSPSSWCAPACCPQDVLDRATSYERKAKEIIQSIRLTEAYPGEDGKQAIMEAYLNNNFYGNRSYGVAAAAQSYWKQGPQGPDARRSARSSPASRKSPTKYDLVQNAVEETVHGRERQGPDARWSSRRTADGRRPAAQPDPRAHEDALGA